jgi:hypothetical protein
VDFPRSVGDEVEEDKVKMLFKEVGKDGRGSLRWQKGRGTRKGRFFTIS